MPSPSLNDIALFVEVVSAGGFTPAARRMEMPVSTLSRRIAALEKQLGLQLLKRSTRKVEATPEGQAYFQRCQLLVEEAQHAHEEIAAHRNTVSGSLRLACTADFASLYLPVTIAAYARAHPAVGVALTLSSRVEDLLAHQLDLAIRLGPLADSTLVAHPLGTLQPGLYASTQSVQAGLQLAEPADLTQHPCIRLGGHPNAALWMFDALDPPGASQRVVVSGRLVAGGPAMAAQLVLQGLGVGLLDRRLAEPLVAEGKLVGLLPAWRPRAVPVHAVTLSRLLPARVRYFIERLRSDLRAAEAQP